MNTEQIQQIINDLFKEFHGLPTQIVMPKILDRITKYEIQDQLRIVALMLSRVRV
jgi:hypothetical protein